MYSWVALKSESEKASLSDPPRAPFVRYLVLKDPNPFFSPSSSISTASCPLPATQGSSSASISSRRLRSKLRLDTDVRLEFITTASIMAL